MCLLPIYLHSAASKIHKSSLTTTILEALDEADCPKISDIMTVITEMDARRNGTLQRSVSDSIPLLLHGIATNNSPQIQRSYSMLSEKLTLSDEPS